MHPQMLQVVEPGDILTQMRPEQEQQGTETAPNQAAPEPAQRPRHHGRDEHQRQTAQGRIEIGRAVSGAGVMRSHGPGRAQQQHGQTAPEFSLATRHYCVRWLAMCAVNARREAKIRVLSALSERSWKP